VQGRICFIEWGGAAFQDRLRCIDGDGRLTTLAGSTSGQATTGTSGTATALSFAGLDTLSQMPSGDIMFSDDGSRSVLQYSSGQVKPIMGGAPSPDSVPRQELLLASPVDITAGKDGNLYVADSFELTVRKVEPRSGLATVVLGSGKLGRNVPPLVPRT